VNNAIHTTLFISKEALDIAQAAMQSPNAKEIREYLQAVLKVGPWLTHAYREAVFAPAMIENQLFRRSRSNLFHVLDQVMLQRPEYWKKHYHGSEEQQAMKWKFSFSDRIRYYGPDPRVQTALTK